MVAQFTPVSAASKRGPQFCPNWPTRGKVGHLLADTGTHIDQLEPFLANKKYLYRQHLATCLPTLARFGQVSADIWPILASRLRVCLRSRPRCGKRRPMLVEFDRIWLM